MRVASFSTSLENTQLDAANTLEDTRGGEVARIFRLPIAKGCIPFQVRISDSEQVFCSDLQRPLKHCYQRFMFPSAHSVRSC
jgi:hypothetical protein